MELVYLNATKGRFDIPLYYGRENPLKVVGIPTLSESVNVTLFIGDTVVAIADNYNVSAPNELHCVINTYTDVLEGIFGDAAIGAKRQVRMQIRDGVTGVFSDIVYIEKVVDGGSSPLELVELGDTTISLYDLWLTIPGNEGKSLQEFFDEGVSGTPGIDGSDGTNGIDGQDGADGDEGIQGDQGIQGIQGIQGDPGANGIDGEGLPPIDERYANTTAMIADQSSQSENYFQQVGTGKDAKFYKKTASSTADISDYEILNEKPVSRSYTDIPTMLSSQAEQVKGYLYKVVDIYYEFLGVATGVIEDYQLFGGGDVTSVTTSEIGNLAGFADEDGKLIKDLGFALEKNTDFKLITFTTDDGCELKFGFDSVIPFYNNTGAELAAGTVLHLAGGALVSGQVLATFEKADATNWEKIQGTLGICACDLPNGATGHCAIKGQFKGIDTSSFGAGVQLWLSATTAGGLTATQPQFPDYPISIGGTATSAVDGEVLVNFTSSYTDTYHEAWDGAIRETFNFTITSNGSEITGLLENVDDSRNLTCLFSDGFHTFDTTTIPATLELVGAAIAGQTQGNYVYIPITTKALTVSTTGFPSIEHCKISYDVLETPTLVQTYGALRNQNINDHIKKEDNNGHILHIAERLRQLNCQWDSGCEATLSGLTSDAFIAVTSGKAWQLHLQSVPAFDTSGSDVFRVVNDETTLYSPLSSLGDITTYSDGSSWNNEWSNVVLWGVANKSGEPSHIFINKPSGGYNSEASAVADLSGYTDYSVPNEFRGVGFLIAQFTIRRSGGTTTYNFPDGYKDLRGFVPNNVAGGGGGGSGIITYLGLTDTPSTRTGQAGKFLKVNDAETDDEYADAMTEQLKNYAINGAHQRWDHATVYSITFGELGYFTANMVRAVIVGGNSIINITRGQLLNQFSYLMSVITAANDLTGTNSVFCYMRRFEAKSVYELNGKNINIAFPVKTNFTGTLSIAIHNCDQTRSYIVEFPVISGVTEIINKTIPLEAGTVDQIDNGMGLQVTIAGDNRGNYETSSIDTWQAGAYYTSTNSTNWTETQGRTVEIGEFQLIEGDKYIKVPAVVDGTYNCERYYREISPKNVGQVISSSNANFNISFDKMRTTPSVDLGSVANYEVTKGTGALVAITGISVASNDGYAIQINTTGAAGLVIGDATRLKNNVNLIKLSSYL